MGKDARESTPLDKRVTASSMKFGRAERHGAMKSYESDNAKSNPGSGMLIPGEPDAGKACAAGRGVESLTQSGEVRRNTSGPSDSPEDESRRGKEHVGKARGIGRR
jgi:hypothetical protein